MLGGIKSRKKEQEESYKRKWFISRYLDKCTQTLSLSIMIDFLFFLKKKGVWIVEFSLILSLSRARAL